MSRPVWAIAAGAGRNYYHVTNSQLSSPVIGCRGGFVVPGLRRNRFARRRSVTRFLRQIWFDERGQDVAEYAVMLAVILVIVVGTIRLIGANANNVFSSVASSISQ
jgi:Flp pilus assembly pilin Flp